MKTFTINIHPELKEVTFTVKNGKKFAEKLIKGEYCIFQIQVCPEDIKRVKQFAIHKSNHHKVFHNSWYAQCNGFAMGLFVNKTTEGLCYITINTYRPYGTTETVIVK